MTYGATSSGYVKKPEAEIIKTLIQRAQLPEYFGPDVDLTPATSPVWKFIHSVAPEIAEVWDGEETRYNESFVSTATGVNLDRLAEQVWIFRKTKVKDFVTVRFSGADSTSVPTGTYVQTLQGARYVTETSGVISGGFVDLVCYAEFAGLDYRVAPNTLTQMVIPIAGVTSVTNALESSGGRDDETDAEFRLRIADQSDSKNRGALAVMLAQIWNEPFVTGAYLYENRLAVPAGEMPPNSLWFIIEGGTDDQVADAIFRIAGATVRLYGSTSVNVTDSQGFIHSISFSRPAIVTTYVAITLVKNSNWVASMESEIITRTIEEIGGTDSVSGITYSGLDAGKSVHAFKLYNALIDIAGIDDASILVGTSPGDEIHTSIAISAAQRARTTNAYITVV